MDSVTVNSSNMTRLKEVFNELLEKKSHKEPDASELIQGLQEMKELRQPVKKQA